MDEPLHEDFLKKEEEKERWFEYWVILKNCVLYFYDDRTDLWQEYCDKIEITANARCSVVRRKTYSYRFKLVTDEGIWLLKCHTNLQRHRWMHAIELAIKEISSGSESARLATAEESSRVCYFETDLFGRSLRREMRQREAARESNNNANNTLELSRKYDLKKEGDRGENRNSRKSSRFKRSVKKALSLRQGLGSPEENLAFSDDEVSVDGFAKFLNNHSQPVTGVKLIRVVSAK